MSSELDEMIDEAARDIVDGWDVKMRSAQARSVVPRLLRYKGSDPELVRFQVILQSGAALKSSELSLVSARLGERF